MGNGWMNRHRDTLPQTNLIHLTTILPWNTVILAYCESNIKDTF